MSFADDRPVKSVISRLTCESRPWASLIQTKFGTVPCMNFEEFPPRLDRRRWSGEGLSAEGEAQWLAPSMLHCGAVQDREILIRVAETVVGVMMFAIRAGFHR